MPESRATSRWDKGYCYFMECNGAALCTNTEECANADKPLGRLASVGGTYCQVVHVHCDLLHRVCSRSLDLDRARVDTVGE